MNNRELILQGLSMRWRRAVTENKVWKARKLMAWFRDLEGSHD